MIGFSRAPAVAGQRLLLRAGPIDLPFAEAAIDVDKPADLELVTGIGAASEENRSRQGAVGKRQKNWASHPLACAREFLGNMAQQGASL